MAVTVYAENRGMVPDLTAADLRPSEYGVHTSGKEELVLRLNNGVVFLESKLFCADPHMYTVRRLYPGEKWVIINDG